MVRIRKTPIKTTEELIITEEEIIENVIPIEGPMEGLQEHLDLQVVSSNKVLR